MYIIGNSIVYRITATITAVVIGIRTTMSGILQHSNRINKVTNNQTSRLTSTITGMEIHSTQGKAQVKVQTKDRAHPLDLEEVVC
jgi:hypothetical protein